ncbi:hypothetical protein A2U01_0100192 [Trifolium medium]|uniref:Uncharacterized protein n=1 Tax=Trifolium medium TaxID=97028 RepID=A0A392UVK7_9FABA|nr:hypothetical protein [Trifolium medium]
MKRERWREIDVEIDGERAMERKRWRDGEEALERWRESDGEKTMERKMKGVGSLL